MMASRLAKGPIVLNGIFNTPFVSLELFLCFFLFYFHLSDILPNLLFSRRR